MRTYDPALAAKITDTAQTIMATMIHRNLAYIARKCVAYPDRKATYTRPLNADALALVEKMIVIMPELLKLHCVAKAESLAIAQITIDARK